MTRDEKLAVIAGDLRSLAELNHRKDDLTAGVLYELSQITADAEDSSGAVDAAKLVLPHGDPVLLAEFCRLYGKYQPHKLPPLRMADAPENADTVAIPEIGRLGDAVDILRQYGYEFTAEYGDSFASCAEDVEYGNSGYVLMPIYDPREGRVRSFDKLRRKCGLKIHCVLYVSDEDGGEYGYQLCGLGYPDDSLFPHQRILLEAETLYDTLDLLKGVLVFGSGILTAETYKGNVNTVTAVLDTENMSESSIRCLLMYLNAAADITIEGFYAEIYHKSKGF